MLLNRLGPDREDAARKYEQLRKALLTYFRYNGSLTPADHVDDTFNRVARSLAEGKDIHIDNPAGYFYGVARNVLRQARSQRPGTFLPLDDLPEVEFNKNEHRDFFKREQESAEHERMIDCLEKCLDLLPELHRELIVQYYDGATGGNIGNRKGLAERFGLSANLLRVKAKRLRDRLEVCVEKCLELN